jgi:hypothetical protein
VYLVWDQGVPGSNPGAPTSLAIAPPRSDGELRIDDSPADNDFGRRATSGEARLFYKFSYPANE